MLSYQGFKHFECSSMIRSLIAWSLFCVVAHASQRETNDCLSNIFGWRTIIYPCSPPYARVGLAAVFDATFLAEEAVVSNNGEATAVDSKVLISFVDGDVVRVSSPLDVDDSV